MTRRWLCLPLVPPFEKYVHRVTCDFKAWALWQQSYIRISIWIPTRFVTIRRCFCNRFCNAKRNQLCPNSTAFELNSLIAIWPAIALFRFEGFWAFLLAIQGGLSLGKVARKKRPIRRQIGHDKSGKCTCSLDSAHQRLIGPFWTLLWFNSLVGAIRLGIVKNIDD